MAQPCCAVLLTSLASCRLLSKGLHREYIGAGAKVCVCNSFVATEHHLRSWQYEGKQKELSDMMGQLISKAVFCAAEARRLEGIEGVLLAGCLPPLGESYQPATRTLTKEAMVRQYEDIIHHMSTSTDQVDVLLCETMSSVGEALACLEAVERSGVSAPLWISFTIEDRVDCAKLRSGEDLQSAVKTLLAHKDCKGRVKAVLVNCSAPASATVALKVLTQAIHETQTCGEDIYTAKINTGAYANGFITTTSQWMISASASSEQQQARSEQDTKCLVKQPESDYYEDTGTIKEEAYTKHVLDWLKIHPSVKVVGGCCGIGVSHIKHLKKHIHAR